MLYNFSELKFNEESKKRLKNTKSCDLKKLRPFFTVWLKNWNFTNLATFPHHFKFHQRSFLLASYSYKAQLNVTEKEQFHKNQIYGKYATIARINIKPFKICKKLYELVKNKNMVLNYCKYVKIQCKKYSHIPLQPFQVTYFGILLPFSSFFEKNAFLKSRKKNSQVRIFKKQKIYFIEIEANIISYKFYELDF